MFREVSTKVKAENYKNMLSEVFPSMKLRFRMFQQDGTSVHTAKLVTQFLDEKCKAGWIGLGSKTQIWPPHSPDLSPLDYGFWPIIQERVKRRGPVNREQLKEFVEDEFQSIGVQTVINICDGMCKRCKNVREIDGGHAELNKIIEIPSLVVFDDQLRLPWVGT